MIHRIEFEGLVGQDAVITENSVRFSLAQNEKQRDNSFKAIWTNWIVGGRLKEIAATLRKGDRVLAIGKYSPHTTGDGKVYPNFFGYELRVLGKSQQAPAQPQQQEFPGSYDDLPF